MTDLSHLNYRHFLLTRMQLVIAVACGVAAVLIVVAAIIPQVNGIIEARAEFQKQEKLTEQLQKKAQALQDADTLQLVQNQQYIDNALPSRKPLLELMETVSQLSVNSQVTIKNIELTPGEISTDSAQVVSKTKNAQYDELEVDLVVQGQLKNINAFISGIENTAPMSNVTKISLNELRSKAVSDDDYFEAELTVSTYYFTQSIKAAVDTPLSQLSAEELPFLEKLKNYSNIPVTEQTTIQGGGLIDLFGLNDETPVSSGSGSL